MRVIPKQKSIDAFHFASLDDFPELLRFVRQDDGGRVEGRVRVDGYKIEALVTLSNGNMKVNRHEWLLRNEEGVYRTISETEFKESYQQAEDDFQSLVKLGKSIAMAKENA